MSNLYGPSHRMLQDAHGTRRLADRLEELAHAEFTPDDRAFIESRPLLFLSTVDEHGRPTVSYKGGAPGFVQITEDGEIAFPSYDGNGMFLSLGNIQASPQVGLLFIDFERPRRLRVQGTARIVEADPLLASYPGAHLLVRIRPSQIFVNCGRYIHRFAAAGLELSPHVPDAAGSQPFPAWKRIDLFQDALPPGEEHAVAQNGGPIPIADYPGEELPAPHPVEAAGRPPRR